jgi:dCMP deaminase
MHRGRPSWDEWWLSLAFKWSERSKDPSTKVGEIIVNGNREEVGEGYNGFPRGIEDKPELLNNREEKYRRVVHAEMNAILTARQPVRGCTLYVSVFSCEGCAKHVIQAGIKRVVAPIPSVIHLERWGKSFDLAKELYDEAGVETCLLDYPRGWRRNMPPLLPTGVTQMAWWGLGGHGNKLEARKETDAEMVQRFRGSGVDGHATDGPPDCPDGSTMSAIMPKTDRQAGTQALSPNHLEAREDVVIPSRGEKLANQITEMELTEDDIAELRRRLGRDGSILLCRAGLEKIIATATVLEQQAGEIKRLLDIQTAQHSNIGGLRRELDDAQATIADLAHRVKG